MNKYSDQYQFPCIVIIGGAGPIGLALSEILISHGVHVKIIDVKKSENEKLDSKPNDNLEKIGTIEFFKLDARSLVDLKSIKKIFKEQNYKIIGLVCMASINTPMDKNLYSNDILTMDLENWREEIDVGLTTAFASIQVFGEEFIDNSYGSIVLVSSDLGIIGPDQRIYMHLGEKVFKSPAYVTSKHALIGLSRHVATSWAKFNVRCNVVAPGPIDLELEPKLSEELRHRIPLGRLAKTYEVANAIKFLLLEESSFITGSTVVVDGGRTSW